MGLWIVTVAGLALCATASSGAGELKAELDFSNKKSFRGFFQHYGPTMSSLKAVLMEETGVRLWVPNGTLEPQMGLYSSGFTLAGDFEISVAYEWLTKDSPRDGYGVSCGIAIEHRGFGKTVGPAGTIALARGDMPGKNKGYGYLVTRGERQKKDQKNPTKTDQPSPLDFHTDHFTTNAATGRLVLKREKDTIVCLVADDLTSELRELDRYKFTRDTVSPVRIVVDQGDQKGSPTGVDAYFSQIRVRAEEIDTTGYPQRERPGNLWWWICGGGLALLGVIAVLAFRRSKQPGADVVQMKQRR